jgi:hypothetical protein
MYISNSRFQSVEAHIAPQLVVASAGELSPLQQLIIWPGEICVLTPKFQVLRFCAKKTLRLLLVLNRAAESEQIDISLIAIAVFQDRDLGSGRK